MLREMSDRTQPLELTPSVLIRAYAAGVFPMAESAEAEEILWIDPELRGIIPLNRFHVPRSLAKRIKQGGYRIEVDRDFEGVNHDAQKWAAATTSFLKSAAARVSALAARVLK